MRHQFETWQFISNGFMVNSVVEIESNLILNHWISQLALTLIDSQFNLYLILEIIMVSMFLSLSLDSLHSHQGDETKHGSTDKRNPVINHPQGTT